MSSPAEANTQNKANALGAVDHNRLQLSIKGRQIIASEQVKLQQQEQAKLQANAKAKAQASSKKKKSGRGEGRLPSWVTAPERKRAAEEYRKTPEGRAAVIKQEDEVTAKVKEQAKAAGAEFNSANLKTYVDDGGNIVTRYKGGTITTGKTISTTDVYRVDSKGNTELKTPSPARKAAEKQQVIEAKSQAEMKALAAQATPKANTEYINQLTAGVPETVYQSIVIVGDPEADKVVSQRAFQSLQNQQKPITTEALEAEKQRLLRTEYKDGIPVKNPEYEDALRDYQRDYARLLSEGYTPERIGGQIVFTKPGETTTEIIGQPEEKQLEENDREMKSLGWQRKEGFTIDEKTGEKVYTYEAMPGQKQYEYKSTDPTNPYKIEKVEVGTESTVGGVLKPIINRVTGIEPIDKFYTGMGVPLWNIKEAGLVAKDIAENPRIPTQAEFSKYTFYSELEGDTYSALIDGYIQGYSESGKIGQFNPKALQKAGQTFAEDIPYYAGTALTSGAVFVGSLLIKPVQIAKTAISVSAKPLKAIEATGLRTSLAITGQSLPDLNVQQIYKIISRPAVIQKLPRELKSIQDIAVVERPLQVEKVVQVNPSFIQKFSATIRRQPEPLPTAKIVVQRKGDPLVVIGGESNASPIAVGYITKLKPLGLRKEIGLVYRDATELGYRGVTRKDALTTAVVRPGEKVDIVKGSQEFLALNPARANIIERITSFGRRTSGAGKGITGYITKESETGRYGLQATEPGKQLEYSRSNVEQLSRIAGEKVAPYKSPIRFARNEYGEFIIPDIEDVASGRKPLSDVDYVIQRKPLSKLGKFLKTKKGQKQFRGESEFEPSTVIEADAIPPADRAAFARAKTSKQIKNALLDDTAQEIPNTSGYQKTAFEIAKDLEEKGITQGGKLVSPDPNTGFREAAENLSKGASRGSAVAVASPKGRFAIGGNAAGYTPNQSLGLGGLTGAERIKRKRPDEQAVVSNLDSAEDVYEFYDVVPVGYQRPGSKSGLRISDAVESRTGESLGNRLDEMNKRLELSSQRTQQKIAEDELRRFYDNQTPKPDRRLVPDVIVTPATGTRIQTGLKDATFNITDQSVIQRAVSDSDTILRVPQDTTLKMPPLILIPTIPAIGMSRVSKIGKKGKSKPDPYLHNLLPVESLFATSQPTGNPTTRKRKKLPRYAGSFAGLPVDEGLESGKGRYYGFQKDKKRSNRN